MGMTSTIDVLLDVRALLARPGGWIQDEVEAPRALGGNAYCIEGAITAVEASMVGWSSARERVEGVVHRPIPVFNDAPTTTQADVVGVIDRAIQAEWRGDPIRPRSQTWETSSSMSGHLQMIMDRLAEARRAGSGPDAVIIPFPDRRDVRRRSRSSN